MPPRSAWLVVLVGSLLGCSPGDPGDRGPAGAPGAPGEVGPAGPPGEAGESAATAGTRLRPRYEVAEDGARAVIPGVWFDEELGVECTFQAAADGQRRCLPAAGFGTTEVPSNPSTYAVYDVNDTACAQPLLFHPTTGCPSTDGYGTEPAVDACAPRSLHRVGALYTNAEVRVLLSACSGPYSTSFYVPAGHELYAATAVAPDAFVAASIE